MPFSASLSTHSGDGVAVALAVAVGVAVAVGFEVAEAVTVGVAVSVGLSVAVGSGVVVVHADINTVRTVNSPALVDMRVCESLCVIVDSF